VKNSCKIGKTQNLFFFEGKKPGGGGGAGVGRRGGGRAGGGAPHRPGGCWGDFLHLFSKNTHFKHIL